MAEGSSLENWRTLTGTVGSNPTLTATSRSESEAARRKRPAETEVPANSRALGENFPAFSLALKDVTGETSTLQTGFFGAFLFRRLGFRPCLNAR